MDCREVRGGEIMRGGEVGTESWWSRDMRGCMRE